MTPDDMEGPWTARRMHTGGFDIVDARGRDVVTVYGGGVEIESREANARLIASAPDLLEALMVLYADYKALADSGDAGFWKLEDADSGKQALAAIARATGEAA